ncbi:MAG: ABC transporter ATP-binding protein [Gammaproteobacteria bacterium]|nr:ABC transporter ATP-binding protein [Gammaproteobacteria bacterium]
MSEQTLIKVVDLSRYYGPTLAVDHISFEIKRGNITGLLGPNGAGKSTTMKMITGNLAPSSGSIEINGVDLLDHPKQAKEKLGYLPEYPPVYKDQTVDEYLGFCAAINNIPKSHRRKSIEMAKARCGLEKVGRKLIGLLSKGYQQRLGIAQAIIHEPEVVVLDEPTVGLDPLQIREIRELIKELGENHSVLLSSHILSEIQALCNHIHIINEGRLVYSQELKKEHSADESQTLVCEFKHPPALEEFKKRTGATDVSAFNNIFKVNFTTQSDIRDKIVRSSLDGNWGMLQLFIEQESLEHTFVKLTMEQHELS